MFSFFHIDILSITLLLVIAYVSRYYYKYFTRESPLPGPFPLPFIGNFFTIIRDISVWPSELQSKYGDIFEVYVGSKRKVWLCNEELTEKIFSFVPRGNFHNRVDKNSDLQEIGIVNTGLAMNIDYDNWLYIQKFYLKAIFSRSFMKQSFVCAQASFQKMENYWMMLGEGTVLDLSQWMKSYIRDTIDLLTISKSSDTLTSYYKEISSDKNTGVSDKDNEYIQKCGTQFPNALLWFRSVPKFIRDFPGINLYTTRLKKQMEYLRNHFLKIVNARREEIEKTPEDKQLTPDLLTMFLTANTSRDINKDENNNRPMLDEEIAPNFMEISLAALVTTSEALFHLLYLTSKYPKVKQRLIQEFKEVFPDSHITYEGINKLVYCDAVLKEAFRISPTAQYVAKRNEEPDQIGGYTFPANTGFFVFIEALNKQKSKWTDPELFNPDRFMDESHPDYRNKIYNFGEGLRKCPGRNLGKLLLKTTLVMLYQKYDLEFVNTENPLKFTKFLFKRCVGFE
ncbi:8500_t:CDS:2, partial [Acaulospora morrowiae]